MGEHLELNDFRLDLAVRHFFCGNCQIKPKISSVRYILSQFICSK